MRIKHLFIDNFRFFKNVEINFADGDGVIFQSVGLYGENGSGKTTLLKIIRDFVCTIHSYFEFLNDTNSTQIDSQQRNFQLLYSIDTVSKALRARYGEMIFRLTISNDTEEDLLISYEKGNISLNKRQLNHILDVTQKSNASFPNIVEQFKSFAFFISPAQESYYDLLTAAPSFLPKNPNDFLEQFTREKFPFLIDHLGTVYDQYSTTQIDDITKKLEKAFIEYENGKVDSLFGVFKKYLDDNKILNGKQIISVKEGIIWFAIENGKTKIPFSSLSAGERQILVRILNTAHRGIKNGVVLIDEPETSLHYTWQQQFLIFMRNIPDFTNNQIIFSSHSEDMSHTCDLFIHFDFDPKTYSLNIHATSTK